MRLIAHVNEVFDLYNVEWTWNIKLEKGVFITTYFCVADKYYLRGTFEFLYEIKLPR